MTALTWTPEDLSVYLSTHHIPAEVVYLDVETPTVPAASAALGVPVEQIVKTIVFLIDDKPYVVFANGMRRVAYRKLAEHLQVNRKKIKLADAETVIALTGYAPGTVSPFGPRQLCTPLIDAAVCEHEVVYAGGGGVTAMMRIRSEDLRRLTGAEVVNVLEDGPQAETS